MSGNQKMAEALIYCYAAMLSKLSTGIVQKQSQEVFDAVMGLSKAQPDSEYVQKYCVVALQYWLHACTKAEW